MGGGVWTPNPPSRYATAHSYEYLYESSLSPPFLILEAPFEYYSHIYALVFLRGHVVSCFPTKILCLFLFSYIRATFPTHLILLGVITPVIFVEGNKLQSSPLCSLLHYHDSSSYKSRYLSQHPIRENPRPMTLCSCETPSFARI